MSVQSKILMTVLDPDFRKKAKFAGIALGSVILGLSVVNRLQKILNKKHGYRKSTKKQAIDSEFIKQLKFLFKIMIPKVFSREVGIIILHSITLMCRTFLTIYVSALEGEIVQKIVQMDAKGFAFNISKWLLVALPATFINSMIRFFESYLGLAFRIRLTNHAYKEYFDNQLYYKVSNLDGRLLNVDQCLTEDINSFTSSVAHLYSHLTKPIFDIVLITITLLKYAREREAGGSVIFPMFLATVVVSGTARILKAISPRFGEMVAEEAHRKGHLRYLHSRVITNSEEIAFYGGHVAEKKNLYHAFHQLNDQVKKIYKKRVPYIMAEQFLMKYVWSGSGLTMIAIPILFARNTRFNNDPDGGVSERTKGFATAKNLLLNSADAAERLMTSYKEITELAGYTTRVYDMFKVMEDVKSGRYQKTLVTSNGNGNLAIANEQFDTSVIRGFTEESNGEIILQDVPIVTPNGDVIVRNMSLMIQPGMNLLITGPNGCGKSSLFRILGELWPVYRGTLRKPPRSRMYYVPQRPYMTMGTLRDQVIYPDTANEIEKKGYTDSDLVEILKKVHLLHIIEREEGFEAKNDWMDVLSGGEKQRMGLARVFYHKPLYALLDECTSAVSIDVEGNIYSDIKKAGITLMTVTHRPSLWKYHDYLLKYSGEGDYYFSTMPSTDENPLPNGHRNSDDQLNQSHVYFGKHI